MSAAALSRASAARYLDMSVDTFDVLVRPFVPFVELNTPDSKRPTLRWETSALDAFLAARRKAA